MLKKIYAPGPADMTRGSGRKCLIRNSDKIVISQIRDESGEVSQTRVCVCELLDTLNINISVDQQGRPPNVERWRFPMLETLFLLAISKN